MIPYINIVRKIMANYPDLSIDGFRYKDRQVPHPATDEVFMDRRSQLVEDYELRRIMTACEYIHKFPIEGQRPVDSYALKHRAERWGHEFGMEGYVTNGAAIVAAVLCGYSIIREKNSPNCRFAAPSAGSNSLPLSGIDWYGVWQSANQAEAEAPRQGEDT